MASLQSAKAAQANRRLYQAARIAPTQFALPALRRWWTASGTRCNILASPLTISPFPLVSSHFGDQAENGNVVRVQQRVQANSQPDVALPLDQALPNASKYA
jgi:hypothetical protein